MLKAEAMEYGLEFEPICEGCNKRATEIVYTHYPMVSKDPTYYGWCRQCIEHLIVGMLRDLTEVMSEHEVSAMIPHMPDQWKDQLGFNVVTFPGPHTSGSKSGP